MDVLTSFRLFTVVYGAEFGRAVHCIKRLILMAVDAMKDRSYFGLLTVAIV